MMLCNLRSNTAVPRRCGLSELVTGVRAEFAFLLVVLVAKETVRSRKVTLFNGNVPDATDAEHSDQHGF